MINLGDRGDGAFAAAAAGALLDADRGRDASDEIHVGTGHLLDELPGIHVHRIQEASLSLGKQEVEGQRAFAGTAHTGEDDKLITRHAQRDVFEIMLAGAMDRNRFAGRVVGNNGG